RRRPAPSQHGWRSPSPSPRTSGLPYGVSDGSAAGEALVAGSSLFGPRWGRSLDAGLQGLGGPGAAGLKLAVERQSNEAVPSRLPRSHDPGLRGTTPVLLQ